MKILSASLIKEADRYTMVNEPITAMSLMERAGQGLFEKINFKFPKQNSFVVFCGPGNNGGDGLVLARLLHEADKQVKLIILKGNYTNEFKLNFQKIKELKLHFIEIEYEDQLDTLNFNETDCIVDALFGVGITRPLEGLPALLVQKINKASNYKVSVDLPSGLSADGTFRSYPENTLLADTTLAIQLPKLAFFFPENIEFTGNFECIDIGISEDFISKAYSPFHYTTADDIEELIIPRPLGGHKGVFGHVLVIAGSEGKSGAAILSSKAALRSGCGLVTSFISSDTLIPLLSNLPEAMTMIRNPDEIKLPDEYNRFNSIGFGPGVGLFKDNALLLQQLIERYKGPLIIDADGLTLLSQNQDWYGNLNPNIILTPHPREFDRLTSEHNSGEERFRTQMNFSKKYSVNIVLKGHYSSVTTNNGEAFFNSTGNNGMATAGSGDVLTGILASLCAQGYKTSDAAILGVFIHGFAGDKAALKYSKTSMIASDIISCLPDAFRIFEK